MSTRAIADPALGRGAESPASAEPSPDRQQLLRLAAEFESMLLLQMLKQMRSSASWGDEEDDGLGRQTLLETADVEFASFLSRAGGVGFGAQLETLFERQLKPTAGATVTAQDVATPDVTTDVQPSPLDVMTGPVTSTFGWRRDPFHGTPRFHRGIDIAAAYGQQIPVAGSGRVVSAGPAGGYGLTVVVEHADGVRTRYAHLSSVLVGAGDGVTEGQAIGLAGHSGRATGTHLHFEVIGAGGHPLDPEQFVGLKPKGVVADLTRAANSVPQETGRDDNTN